MLSLERLDQVVEYVPEDMTITVQPGMRLGALQALTASHSQAFPLDPPRAAQATIGGIVATAASGPRRMAYGGVRDLVLGVRLALPDGRVIKAGGKVVKNVAGYDMPKLVIGSLGTIGIVTEVSLRLRPVARRQPHAAVRVRRFWFCDCRRRVHTQLGTAPRRCHPSLARGRPPFGNPRHRFSGRRAGGNRREQRLPGGPALPHDPASRSTLTGEAESNFWDRLVNYGDRFGSAFRLRVNTVVGDLAEHLEAPDLEGIAYAASGTVILYGMADGTAAGETVRSRMARASAAGGSAVLESGPVELRRQVDVWGSARPEWKFTHGIRRTFDPALVLNRGRYVGGV